MAGPLALGMLALLNVELGAWNRRTIKELAAGPEVPKDENIKASAEVEGREGEPTSAGSISQGTTAEGKEEPLRTRIITNVMRVGAIAFVPIASQAPGVRISLSIHSHLQSTTRLDDKG